MARILFPGDRFTKGDVAAYYQRIAPHMLPWLKGRPLTLRQYPEGIDGEGFFHKHASEHFPDFIHRIEVPMHSDPGKLMVMVSADAAEDLVYFAGQHAIEIHMALATAGHLDNPDQMVFDFDPSDGDFGKVRTAALALKTLLDDRKLPAFVKTSGSRGVHVHVPLAADRAFAEVKAEARAIAGALQEQLPDITTLEHRVKKRGDKVYLDILRNDHGMNVVAPYSLRAKPGAPVATPIDWEELADPALGPQRYTLKNIFRRLARKADPWRDFRLPP